MKFSAYLCLLPLLGSLWCGAREITANAAKCFASKVDAGEWTIAGSQDGKADFADGKLVLTPNHPSNGLYLGKMTSILPGTRYTVSCTLRMKEGKYAIYLEYTGTDNKRHGINGVWNPAPGENPHDVKFYVNLPEGSKDAKLLIGVVGCQSAEITNYSVLGAELDPAILSNWRGGKLEKKEGKTQLLIADKQTAFAPAVLKEKQFYRFECRGATIQSNDTTGFAQLVFRVKIGDKIIYQSAWDDLIGGSGSGKEYFFQSTVSGTANVEISSRGKICIWQCKLSEVAPESVAPVTFTLQNPACYNTIFVDRREDIKGNLMLKAPAVKAKITLTAADIPDKVLFDVESNGGTITLEGSKELPVGKYTLSITPVDAENNSLTGCTLPVTVSEVPQVCYRYNPADNTYYRNGHPIHYHGFFRYIPGLDYLYRRNGVTTFIVISATPEDLLKKLNEADKNGFRLIFELRVLHHYKKTPGSLEAWKKQITYMLTPEILNHPALCGYCSVDEPAWTAFPMASLREVKNYLHEIDPSRPVWVNEAPRGSIEVNRQVAACSDAFGVDIYPIPQPSNHSGLDDKFITSVGAYTRRCREAAGSNMPIWMVLQGFAWGELHQKTPVYPTREETRYMALEAMVNGANAVLYWGMHYTKNAKFYLDLIEQVGEVGNLSKLWQTGNTLKISAAKGIQTFAGMIDGERFIVALNTTGTSLDSELDLTGLYELPAGIPVKDTKFAPYTARVFASVPRYPGDFTERIPYDKEAEAAAMAILEDNFASGMPYTGKANWIWYPGDHKVDVCSNTLSREFILQEIPTQAVFGVSADDSAEVWFNGRKIGTTTSWNKMKFHNVTKLLKAGKNELEIRSKSEQAPSGVLAELNMKYANGREEIIVSDAKWQASKQGGKTCSAEVIVPYGEGPWKNNVLSVTP